MGLINFSGIASGIDTEGLIKATSDATRATRITPLQNKASEAASTDDALTELKTRLGKLKTVAQPFLTSNGGGIVKSATSSDESILGATASNSAFNGTYHITVDAKATNGVTTFADVITNLDGVVDADLTAATYPTASDRYLTVQIGTGSDQKTINITLDETTTYSSIINSFNSDATMSSVGVMSAVNVSNDVNNPSYRLVVSSLNEGTQKGTVAVSRGAALTTEAVFDPGAVVSQAAGDAQLDITGIGSNIKRPSNVITDLIPGVTLNLQDDSVTEVTLSVQNDAASSRAKVEDFVSAWNDVVTFMAEQNLVQRQENGSSVTNTFAPLSKSRVDEGSLSAIRSVLSSTRVSLGVNIDGLEESLVMSSIGIKTNQNGTLTFQPDTTQNVPAFNQLLAEKPEALNNLLKRMADSLATTGGAIDQYTGFNRLIDQTINSNKRQIDDYNRRISDAEAAIAKTELAMRARFARLEAQMGKLQSQQQQLSASLG